jgi:subtilase family serine protease
MSRIRRTLRASMAAGLFLAIAGFSAPAVSASAGLQFAPLAVKGPRVPTKVALAHLSGGGVTSDGIHYYFPADIRAAYGVDAVSDDGTGQTIVIVDAYGSPTAQQDLDTFDSAFGLPAANLTTYYPCGTPTFSPNALKGAQVGWAEETSLDLQWAHAIAPGAHLVLVAANPAETQGVQGFPCIFKGEQWAIQNHPGAVISQSFAVTEQSFHGAADPQVAKYDKVYQAAQAANITVFGSSGDSGTANGDKQGRVFPYPTVNWPSSDPLVTSAGGTQLQYGWRWDPTISADQLYAGGALSDYLNYTAGGTTEAVWKEDWLPAASGGGLSALFSTPSFQSGISSSLLQGTRGLPDLSWNAAVNGGVLTYLGFLGSESGFYIFGGTSSELP